MTNVNVIHDQKEITKLISVIDEYYLRGKLNIYIYISKYFSEILNKKEIILDAHSGILSGHYSVEKTLLDKKN